VQSAVGSLMDYGARIYSPLLGRFLSADSVVPRPGDPQSLNRYSYVYNSPLVNIDPSGHDGCAAGDNACWVQQWMWQNRWYEAHGRFWDGHGWNIEGDAKFADMGILIQTLGEAGIKLGVTMGLGDMWTLPELSLVGQGVMALARRVGGMDNLGALLGGGEAWFVRLRANVTVPSKYGWFNLYASVGLGQVSDAVTNFVEFFNGLFTLSDDGVRGRTVHELGHVIDYHNLAPVQRGGQWAAGRLSEAIPGRMTNDISWYGRAGAVTAVDMSEYFSEALADWVYGSRYQGPYGKNFRGPITHEQAAFFLHQLIRH
jgi:RHS repeat-associated protein